MVTLPNGGQVRVHKGEHWAADDPVVRQTPSLFGDDERYGLRYTQVPAGFDDVPVVETATAAPGEKRAARRA